MSLRLSSSLSTSRRGRLADRPAQVLVQSLDVSDEEREHAVLYKSLWQSSLQISLHDPLEHGAALTTTHTEHGRTVETPESGRLIQPDRRWQR